MLTIRQFAERQQAKRRAKKLAKLARKAAKLAGAACFVQPARCRDRAGASHPIATRRISSLTSSASSSLQTASITRSASQSGHPVAARSRSFCAISWSVIGRARLPRACITSALNTLPAARSCAHARCSDRHGRVGLGMHPRAKSGNRLVHDQRLAKFAHACRAQHEYRGNAVMDADLGIALVVHRDDPRARAGRGCPATVTAAISAAASRMSLAQIEARHRSRNAARFRRDRACRYSSRSPRFRRVHRQALAFEARLP